MAIPPSLQNALTWPIKAKGAVERLNPLGDPAIETKYHAALEQGRHLERCIGDANHWLLQKKQQLEQRIQTYLDMNSLAVDGQLKHKPRVIKYIFDSINMLKVVAGLQKDIIGLIEACTKNLGLLSSIEQNMVQMVQANLNAVAILLNNICNWGLPDLPAIPNFFSDTTWNWNGFNFFPLAAFQPHLGFDFNFAFNQCVVHIPNIDIFRNYPSSVQTYSGLSYGSLAFAPPLGGIIPNTGVNLSDPNFIGQMQRTNTDPYYLPANLAGSLPPGSTATVFNPNSSMLGAVPDPNTIIDNYQMPAQTYHDNIVSILPTIRQNTIEPTDTDYNNPDLASRQNGLRRDLVHFVTLEQVVASGFDPYVTSAWLFYLDIARNGRSGNWLANFQAAYDQYIQPSINALSRTGVPWNNVLGGPGLQNTPADIPFVTAVKPLTGAAQTTVLWKLSYVEAAILGYTRSQAWDFTQDANYLSGTTGPDLDYQPTSIDVSATNSATLGVGTADFPVPVTYPSAINAVLQQVISQAAQDILNDTTYQSPRLANRFVFDQFSQATTVDRFSQFWRDFATNLKTLLAQDPFLVQFAATYFGTLNGAVNPLGGPAAFNALKADAAARNRSWTPGTPLLPVPKAPVVSFQNNTTPADGASGWVGTSFDPVAFLSRPDIQGQPIPVQIAMLRTNLSFAGISQWRDAMSAEIQSQIASATALLASAQQFGFQVESASTTTTVPPTAGGAQVVFDQIDFDLVNNVVLPNTFVVRSTGNYAFFGSLNWDTGPAGGVRTATVFRSTDGGATFNPILSQDTDPSMAGPTVLSFSSTGNFTQGDIVQLVAATNLSVAQNVLPGSFFSMVQTGALAETVPVPASATTNTRAFTVSDPLPSWVGPSFPELTAISTQADGTASPIDPFVSAITHVAIDALGTTLTLTVPSHHFQAGDIIILSGLGTADFLTGATATVASAGPTSIVGTLSPVPAYPSWVTLPYSAADMGFVLRATGLGGAALAPIPDGISLVGGAPGEFIQVGTAYGGVFQVSGATFVVGGLLYAGPAGLLTQDYASLLPAVGWVICVGRAIAADTFIYEPHVPTRFSSMV